MTVPSKLAKHTIAVFNKNNMSVDNLTLQKVMFLSSVDYMKHIKERLIPNETFLVFSAWKYGPASPDDFYYYRKYGRASILDDGEYYDDFQQIDFFIEKYIGRKPYSLMIQCQKSRLWQESKEVIVNGMFYPKYTIEDLEREINHVL